MDRFSPERRACAGAARRLEQADSMAKISELVARLFVPSCYTGSAHILQKVFACLF
jgi:hypothetical protein